MLSVAVKDYESLLLFLKFLLFRFFYISNIFKTFNLGFDNILFEEAGTFKCIVGNEYDVKISKTFHIEVKGIS